VGPLIKGGGIPIRFHDFEKGKQEETERVHPSVHSFCLTTLIIIRFREGDCGGGEKLIEGGRH